MGLSGESGSIQLEKLIRDPDDRPTLAVKGLMGPKKKRRTKRAYISSIFIGRREGLRLGRPINMLLLDTQASAFFVPSFFFGPVDP